MGRLGNQFLNRPNMIRDPGFHRGRDPQFAMNPAEIVKREVKRER